MLIVKTYLDKSRIHGIGLFAAEEIPAGAVIWRPGFEMLYTPDEFAALSSEQKRFVEIWGWRDRTDRLHHLSLDNDRFMNHSDVPNTNVAPDGLTVAVRDIAATEEILCDYAEFEADFRFEKI